MASILGDGTGPGGPGPSRCLLLLQRSLAIQLIRGPPSHVANGQRESPKEHPADEMWMYDKGYNLFQVSRVIVFVHVIRIFLSFGEFSSTVLWSLGKQHRPPFHGFLLVGAGKVQRKRERWSDVATRLRSDSPCPLLCSLFSSSRAARGSFTVKRTLIARTVTPQWDNVNYEQFRKSRHNRGAAG